MGTRVALPTAVTIPEGQLAATSPGVLRVLEDVPGIDPLFYTVTANGGRYHTSGLFSAGDIEAVAPNLKVVSRSQPIDEYQEPAELEQFSTALARLEAMGMPVNFDFTDILEP
jgi:hypothetical protein